jgi:hypothetical protein
MAQVVECLCESLSSIPSTQKQKKKNKKKERKKQERKVINDQCRAVLVQLQAENFQL